MPSPQVENPIQQILPEDKLIFQQDSFSGGMNQQVDSTRLESNEYPLAVNCRTRYGVVEPEKLPADADPQGTLTGRKIQGTYSAGPYFIVFADGKAYYKNVTQPNSAFNVFVGFLLDANVDNIYAEQVPASSMNFGRKLTTAADISGGVTLFSSVNGSPQCLVCQDGINQPFLIFEDGTVRRANSYDAWTTDNREYVPIGHMMLYLNGILYIVADVVKDSFISPKRQIFRSVQGRPLDFVINIDNDGNKGGDASTTSYAVDYDEITCITRVNASNGSFFISTAKNSYLVTPDYTGPLPFNQPTFTTQYLFNTGPINQFSLCDKTGDACFIDFGGIRSFNAVLQDKNEGRNQPFSKKVALMFASLTQTLTAAVTFDDYSFFAVNTIYGPGVLVYDTIQETWVCLDIYDNFEADEYIIQFCEVKVGSTRSLFCRTTENKIYQLFAGTEFATCKLYLGDWCSNDALSEVLPETLKCVFADVETTGTVGLIPFVDRKSFDSISQALVSNSSIFAPPIALPFGTSVQDSVRNINFALDNIATGWKVGFFLSWNFAAQLTHARFEGRKCNSTEATDEQAASLYGS